MAIRWRTHGFEWQLSTERAIWWRSQGELRSALEQFLFADCGYEFLEVERLEVGYVLEVAGSEGDEGGLEHCCSVRIALMEAGVRVPDDVSAFAGSVADEEAWTLLKVFCEA